MLYARVTYDANSGKNGDDDNDYQEFDNSESGCGFPHRYEYTPPPSSDVNIVLHCRAGF
jgi:hypothetical protein